MRTISIVAVLATTAAAGTPGRVHRVDAAPPREVVVPGGTFSMGILPDDVDGLVSECKLATFEQRCEDGAGGFRKELDNLAMHRVHVDAFAIDRDEVSVRDYKKCVEAGACSLDPLVAGPPGYVTDDLPIVEITWPEARDYCAWRHARLPTEAEWERAARGDDARIWPWGEAERADDWNHGKPPDEVTRQIDFSAAHKVDYFYALSDDSDGHALAAPPGAYRWGEGPFGTLDQAGNVAEWVADIWSDKGYTDLGNDDPVRDAPDVPGPMHHVFRGGSWAQAPYLGRTDVRDPYNERYDDDQRTPYIGFRCARSL
ncbi:MAG TPA: SUMF1/EgtB/PvdO family nonheme iron enzyme [Kofleriaceae bacterium]|nr:SUMF1/EgtB/PvdO family nonheme iron enzyme [Kofleriaceae bacterium]